VSSAGGDTSNNCEFCFARTGRLDNKSEAPGCFVLATKFVQGEDKERLFEDSIFSQKARFPGRANFADHKYFCRDSCKAAGTATPTVVTDMKKTLEEQKADLVQSGKNAEEIKAETLQGEADKKEGTALTEGIKENADKLLAALVAKIGASEKIAAEYELRFQKAIKDVDEAEYLLKLCQDLKETTEGNNAKLEESKAALKKLQDVVATTEGDLQDAFDRLKEAEALQTKVTAAEDKLKGTNEEKDELADSLTDVNGQLASSREKNAGAEGRAKAAQEAKEEAENALEDANTESEAAEELEKTAIGASEEAKEDLLESNDELSETVIAFEQIEKEAEALKKQFLDDQRVLIEQLNAQKEDMGKVNQEFQELVSKMEEAYDRVQTRKITMQETDMWHVFVPVTDEDDDCDQAGLPDGSNLCAIPEMKMDLTRVEDWKIFMDEHKSDSFKQVFKFEILATVIKSKKINKSLWGKLTTFANDAESDCWFMSNGERRVCKLADDLFYRAASPSAGTKKDFKVADECISPRTYDDQDKFKGILKKTLFDNESRSKVNALGTEVKAIDSKEQQTKKMGDMEGTCYDKKIFADEGSERDVIRNELVEDGHLVDNARRLRFRRASTTPQDLAQAPDPVKAQAKGLARTICKDADALAELISGAADRQAALQLYLDNLGDLIERVKALKEQIKKESAELTEKEAVFTVTLEGILQEKKVVTASLTDLFEKLETMNEDIKKINGGSSKDKLKRLEDENELMESQNAENKEKLTRLGDEIGELDGLTENLENKAGDDEEEASGLRDVTEGVNGVTEDSKKRTEDLDAETTEATDKIRENKDGKEELNAKIGNVEGEIARTEGKRESELPALNKQLEGVKQEIAGKQEELEYYMDQFNDANEQYNVYDEIFQYCHSMKCYRSCRTGVPGALGEQPGVLPECEDQDIVTQTIGSTLETTDPNVVAKEFDNNLDFIPNAFGCKGENVDLSAEDKESYGETEADEKKYGAMPYAICEGMDCILETSREEVKTILSELADQLLVLRLSNRNFNVKLEGRYKKITPLGMSEEEYKTENGKQFESHEGWTWKQYEAKFPKEAPQKKTGTLCRTDTIKSILADLIKEKGGDDNLDWICTGVADKIGADANVRLFLSMVENGACKVV